MKHIIKTQDNSTTPAFQCVENEEIEQKKGKEERHLRLWATRNSPEAFRSVGSNWLKKKKKILIMVHWKDALERWTTSKRV
jgi:hypothetical protein